MPYGDNTLNANHKWSFNNTLNDDIGALTLTNTGGIFVTTPITRDSTHSYQTNGRDDRAESAGSNDINLQPQSQYAIGGWFMASQIQGPPTCIYKQGGITNNFCIFLWAGNNVMFQWTVNTTTVKQIFSDFALTDNRPYHFLIKFSGSNFDNKFSAYIDGVEQTSTADGQTADIAEMPAHTSPLNWGEAGSTGLDVNIGNSNTVLVKGVINGFYSQWWSWNSNNAALSDNNIREDIFAPGAIPEFIISSDTEVNMQFQLDTIANTTRGDEPLCILVEEVVGGGDLNLIADNILFNNRASIHVRYEGTGTLNWTNSGTSNATLSSGNVNFLNPSQLTLTNIQNNTEVRIYLAGTQIELAGQESVTTGVFTATISQTPIDIRLLSLGFINNKLSNIDITNDLLIDVVQFLDRQYENL